MGPGPLALGMVIPPTTRRDVRRNDVPRPVAGGAPRGTVPRVLDLALTWLPTVFGVLALVTVPSVLLQRQGRPTAALSWLFALFAVPYLTVPAWWFAGRTHLGRRKARRKHAASRFTGALAGTRTRP